MTSRRRLFRLWVVIALLPIPMSGALRPEHKKHSVSYLYLQPNATGPLRPWVRLPNATEPPALRSIASFSLDYDTFELFEVAVEKLDAFVEKVQSIGLLHREASSLDKLYLPGAIIDTRSLVPIDPSLTPRAAYKPDEYGLYVMAAAGYWKPEWNQQLADAGVINLYSWGWIVGATPEIARRLYELPWVQYVEPYHPFLKPKPPLTDEPLQFMSFEFAKLPGMEAGQDRLQALGLGVVTQGTVVSGFFEPRVVPSILAEPTVLGPWGMGGIIVSAPPPAPPPPSLPPALVPTLHPFALFALAGVLLLVAWWKLIPKV